MRYLLLPTTQKHFYWAGSVFEFYSILAVIILNLHVAFTFLLFSVFFLFVCLFFFFFSIMGAEFLAIILIHVALFTVPGATLD